MTVVQGLPLAGPLAFFGIILNVAFLALVLAAIWGFFSMVRSLRNIEQGQLLVIDRLNSIERELRDG